MPFKLGGNKMSFGDIFKGKEFRAQIEQLQKENTELQALNARKIKLEAMPVVELEKTKHDLNDEVNNLTSKRDEAEIELVKLNASVSAAKSKRESLQQEIVVLTDDISMQDYGLYRPQYSFASALEYKDKLADIRKEQKAMIKAGKAGIITSPLSFNNSLSKGKAIQKKNIKQLLRSFNGECEAAINKVTYSNFDRVTARIQKSFEQLNKLNEGNAIKLTSRYLELKNDELHLAFEYETKKQEEKEELREQRAREREEKQAQKEIADKQKQLTKDLEHFQRALTELKEKAASLEGQDLLDAQAAMAELETNISESEEQQKDLDFRKDHATAGYVYIISNIGSFGEGVVKIGVTRRLEPMDRIDELGSASVPFKFDVHALIFSYDAYSLEADLHHRFDKQRINKVNMRKEYFKVSISEIEQVLKQYQDLTVDFSERADAPEYRQSLAMK
jgi:hypothetical protein